MVQFRRFLAIALVLCMGICLCACGENTNTSGSTQEANQNTGSTGNTEPSNTTGATNPAPDDGKVDYTVTVVYPDGTPVVGAYVQICLDDLCYTPEATDENGVATFRLAQQDGYKTKLAVAQEGYVHADYIYFESGATAITIQLVAE